MPESDNFYGSQFRVFEPISSRLKVEQGEAKPVRTRQKQATYKMTGLADIERGDRSGTAWMRVKSGKETASNQGQGEDEVLEIGNSGAEDEWVEASDLLIDWFEDGLIDEDQLEEGLELCDNFLESNSTNIIS